MTVRSSISNQEQTSLYNLYHIAIRQAILVYLYIYIYIYIYTISQTEDTHTHHDITMVYLLSILHLAIFERFFHLSQEGEDWHGNDEAVIIEIIICLLYMYK
jgi:hypothetical protein